jgi:hypothetical protein
MQLLPPNQTMNRPSLRGQRQMWQEGWEGKDFHVGII